MRIAILGAECTGKSTLGRELVQHLQSSEHKWTLAGEYLREWCQRHQRVPSKSDQALIAKTQSQRIDALSLQGQSVVADTTALMTAIYSDIYFQDTALYLDAVKHQQSFDLTLVTATDVPWIADGYQRDGEPTRSAVDNKLRSVLRTHQIAHAVIYGTGAARCQCALDAIGHWKKNPPPRSTHDTDWKWACESCSDPDCEHRFFSGLLNRT